MQIADPSFGIAGVQFFSERIQLSFVLNLVCTSVHTAKV